MSTSYVNQLEFCVQDIETKLDQAIKELKDKKKEIDDLEESKWKRIEEEIKTQNLEKYLIIGTWIKKRVTSKWDQVYFQIYSTPTKDFNYYSLHSKPYWDREFNHDDIVRISSDAASILLDYDFLTQEECRKLHLPPYYEQRDRNYYAREKLECGCQVEFNTKDRTSYCYECQEKINEALGLDA